MKINVDVTGFNEAIASLQKMSNAEKELIPILENSFKRYQISAFRKAPVLTGRLQSTLVDDRFVKKEFRDGYYSITQRQGTYSNGKYNGASYLLLQEFTNPNGKTRFVRDSILQEHPKLDRELVGLLERLM